MQGILIPIGGNEDKGIGKNEMYTLEFIGKGILANVVKESGGTDAKIVVITTASSIPQEIGQNYMEAFNKLGCRNVIILDIRDREKSEEPEILQIILDADCVLFSGGDQSKIVDFIGATSLHQLLFKKLEQTHFVLAGTSAGAMCMSKEMIKGGHSSDALFKGGVHMRDGMGFCHYRFAFYSTWSFWKIDRSCCYVSTFTWNWLGRRYWLNYSQWKRL